MKKYYDNIRAELKDYQLSVKWIDNGSLRSDWERAREIVGAAATTDPPSARSVSRPEPVPGLAMIARHRPRLRSCRSTAAGPRRSRHHPPRVGHTPSD
jgi:hypothetical protein